MMQRPFVAGMSTHPVAGEAAGEVVASVLEQLGDDPAELAFCFVAGSHVEQMEQIVQAVHSLIGPETLLATSAVGVIGGGEESENGPAVSLFVGRTGPIVPLRLEALHPRPDTPILGLPDHWPDDHTLILIADPFSFPVDALMSAMPNGMSLVGGLASFAGAPGGNRLWLDEQEHNDGAIGVLVPAELVEPVVSQGCRPIGDPWVVTRAEGNLIHELAGAPALERVQEMIAGLEAADRHAAAAGLHIGIVANEQRERHRQGDFLIRGVMGVERNTQAVAVGAVVEVGALVQFQVRDDASATAELASLMVPGDGAIVFTCNGRGTHLFDHPHHDARAVQERTSGGVAGMFCAGEIGPIGTTNAVHGFTATVAVFRVDHDGPAPGTVTPDPTDEHQG